MYLTWIAIIASLLMGIGAALVFIFAVKKDYFRNIKNRERHSADRIVSASASLKTSLQEPSE
jgi:hypothetical protein